MLQKQLLSLKCEVMSFTHKSKTMSYDIRGSVLVKLRLNHGRRRHGIGIRIGCDVKWGEISAKFKIQFVIRQLIDVLDRALTTQAEIP